MFHPGHQPATSNPIAGQLVGHQDPGHVLQSCEQLTKEPGGGLSVAVGGDQDVQHIPVLVHRAPQVVGLASDLDEHLVQMPLVAWSGPTTAQAVGVDLPKFATPLVDGVVGDAHTAFSHHLLDITQAQREPMVQPHAVANDLHREPVTFVQRRRRGIHAPMLVHTRHAATRTPSPVNLTVPFFRCLLPGGQNPRIFSGDDT
jgi:hypothetical protein